MTVRTQMVIISYTLAVVLFGFVQYAHESWDTTATAPAAPAAPAAITVTLIASGGVR